MGVKNNVKKILVATHNSGKLQEIKLGLKPLQAKGIKLLSLNDLSIKTEPEETGKTFEENALIKAKYYANLTSLPTISDDGGVAIESLNGEPGVKSRMWLGRPASDEELITYTLKRLKGLPKEKRKGYFETCVCFYNLKTRQAFLEKARVYGYFTHKTSSRRVKGYPFRSLFIIDELDKYYDELSVEEHARINHRLKAVKRLVKKISSYLLQ